MIKIAKSAFIWKIKKYILKLIIYKYNNTSLNIKKNVKIKCWD